MEVVVMVRPCIKCDEFYTYNDSGICSKCRAADPAPVACVPDDGQESYEQRRKRLAAERNPGRVTCDHSHLDGERWWCFICGATGDNRGEGIQRAVRGLSQVEHRVGAARWEP
jgi:hypothetical protein